MRMIADLRSTVCGVTFFGGAYALYIAFRKKHITLDGKIVEALQKYPDYRNKSQFIIKND